MNWNNLLCKERIRSYQKSTTSRDLRTEFEKDYHRIIGSAAFRRLQDKTQVFPLDKSDYIRTRLTHSLEVSSFAKSLAQNVGERLVREKMDDDFDPNPHTPPQGPGPGPGPVDPPGPPKVKPIVGRDGCKVEIIHKTVSIYDANGKLLRQESIVDYTKENVRGEYASLDAFISEWRKNPNKSEIRDMLLERGIDLSSMKEDQNMADVDDFDFICHVAYDKKPLTRRERANNVKKRDFLSKYSGVAREVLEALLDKYMNSGIYEIEKTEILRLDPFMKLGKPAKIASFFGGKAGYMKAIQELEDAIYMDEAV